MQETSTDVQFGPRCPVGIRLDSESGLLAGLARRDGSAREIPVTLEVTLITGGEEVSGPTGGLTYIDTTRTLLEELRLTALRWDDEGSASRLTVSAQAEDWLIDVVYRLNERPPHVALELTVRRTDDSEPEILRDAVLTFTYDLGDSGDWILNAPGNQLRSDLRLTGVQRSIIVRGAGEGEGSSGLMAFSRRGDAWTTLLWPVCQTEMGQIDLAVDDGVIEISLATGLAEPLGAGSPGVTWQRVYLDCLPGPWPEVRTSVAAWWRNLGLAAPDDTPQWLRRANIYEAFIGFAIFAGQRLEGYPSVAALRADLPRIASLGFDVLEVMPQHPYPSYNVHDYADITTTYGDEKELRELIAEAHERGIRVLLDIIMHGVIDKEVMDETLAAVLAGPHADRLDDATIDVESRFPEEISWGRHIVDFAPYWRDGSPDHHSLPDEHPEWFMRDSQQKITRRYTKAFDVANRDWQRYFIGVCRDLINRLDLDGFRVDAPTYNNFTNWSSQRSARASYSSMAPLQLLRDLRAALRADNRELAVYTEPTGSLWRSVADATYNYDEHWLVEALLAEPRPHWKDLFVRTPAQMGRWLLDRDATLPPGATVVHHVDSHDSMWWNPPGERWRLERFGQDATVALVAAFSMIGGAFMTFMGGEAGIEDALRRAHDLRRRLPEMASGTVDFGAVTSTSDAVLTVLRKSPEGALLVAVNLTPSDVSCGVSLAGHAVTSRLRDYWNDEWVDTSNKGGQDSLYVTFSAFQPRLLRIAGGESSDDGRLT